MKVLKKSNQKITILWGLTFFMAVGVSVDLRALTPEQRGYRIVNERDRRDTGFDNSKAAASMILRNRQGATSKRSMRILRLEQKNDGDKTLVVFDDPRDVKGTALLTYTHRKGSDDQWLYLPAMRRVKRISSSNRSGSFVGSEFSFEDLLSEELAKYTYRYIREETVAGHRCHVVERYPAYKNSGYTKQVLWMDKSEYRLWKIEFYDRKRSKIKTLTYSGYKQYLQRFWRASKFTMVNHQNGKSTEIRFKQWSFRTGLTDRDFDQRSLQRVR